MWSAAPSGDGIIAGNNGLGVEIHGQMVVCAVWVVIGLSLCKGGNVVDVASLLG